MARGKGDVGGIPPRPTGFAVTFPHSFLKSIVERN